MQQSEYDLSSDYGDQMGSYNRDQRRPFLTEKNYP